MTGNVIVRKAEEGKHVISGSSLFRVIAEGVDTGQRYSLMETILEPGQGAPFHIHEREDEAFFILEGEVTFYLGSKQVVAKQEDFISCPPHSIRAFRNHQNRDARMLLFYSSAGIEDMTLRDGELVESGTRASTYNSGQAIQCPQLAEEYGVREWAAPDDDPGTSE